MSPLTLSLLGLAACLLAGWLGERAGQRLRSKMSKPHDTMTNDQTRPDQEYPHGR